MGDCGSVTSGGARHLKTGHEKPPDIHTRTPKNLVKSGIPGQDSERRPTGYHSSRTSELHC